MEQIHDTSPSRSEIQPKKLSHFNLASRNWEETSKFYIDLLGMKISDWIKDVGVFMRCAPEYHSLVFTRAKENKVNHCMYEVEGYDMLMRAVEIMRERGVPIVYGPGRHGPGCALYLYCQDSEGNTFCHWPPPETPMPISPTTRTQLFPSTCHSLHHYLPKSCSGHRHRQKSARSA